jgi:zinc transport system permease protein
MTIITTLAIIPIMKRVAPMFDSAIIFTTLAGVGVAIAAAPLGCFVVWRRMSYFGDATAHAAILGIALSLALSTNIFIGVLLVSIIMAVIVSSLSGRGYAVDTLLGVMAHATLAFGLIAVSFIKGVDIDLESYLFGDIASVTASDTVIIWGGAALVLGMVIWRWSALLTATLNPDLAYAEGINPKREQLILTLSLAIVVAVAIKVVGVLLITAMLIIPAATARPFSKTPETMAILATLIGALSAIGGLQAARLWNTPTGPTIVSIAALLFIISNIARTMKSAT